MAPGSLSMAYLWLWINMMGTPGIFLILRFKSLSHVATMKSLFAVTSFTMQSSAYVPLCVHVNRWKRGSFVSLIAILYLCPNFSNSAITQSEMYGMHLPYKQSIAALKMSSLFMIEKFKKL